MSGVSSEGGNIQNVFPRGLDEIPSPDPDGGKRYVTSFDSQELESQTKYEYYKGVQQYYKHKGQWSRFLLWAIGCMIGYQMIILVLVGFRVLDLKIMIGFCLPYSSRIWPKLLVWRVTRSNTCSVT